MGAEQRSFGVLVGRIQQIVAGGLAALVCFTFLDLRGQPLSGQRVFSRGAAGLGVSLGQFGQMFFDFHSGSFLQVTGRCPVRP